MRKNQWDDPLSVRTDELAKVLQRWIDEFYADRPKDSGPPKKAGTNSKGGVAGDRTWFGEYMYSHVSDRVAFQGPIELLSNHLGVDTGVLRRILKRQTKHTTYGLADEILQYIERPDVVQTGEVRVIPNPAWDKERWHEYMEERGCVD